jgi:hypothetical protein
MVEFMTGLHLANPQTNIKRNGYIQLVASAPISIGTTALERALIRFSGVDTLHKIQNSGPGPIRARSGYGRFEWKTHLHIGRGHFITGKPGTFFEFGLQLVQILL